LAKKVNGFIEHITNNEVSDFLYEDINMNSGEIYYKVKRIKNKYNLEDYMAKLSKQNWPLSTNINMSCLFIGSFLSEKRGTKGVGESIAELLEKKGIIIKLVSKQENKLLRVIDIILAIILYKGKKLHIDVFSGPAFSIVRVASSIATYRNKKIILTLHGGKLKEFAMENSKQIDIVFNKAYYIQTPSLFLKEYFESFGYTIHYLPNPILLENFPYKRVNVKKHSLLWVRGFTSIYNPTIPIIILSKLLTLYPHATLTMIGPDSGLLNECKELANKLNVFDRIDFTGKIDNHKLYRYYQSHHVFLNTTSYESFGVALIEAASCGIPIVSNKVGEIPYLWEEKNNVLLVNDNNLDEFLSCIKSIFDNESLSNSISLNARKKAESFAWENIKNDWKRLLELE
jgi:glycosyltransferase involved in cell wall biosynthesis